MPYFRASHLLRWPTLCLWSVLLLLLLSRFSRVQICETPEMAAHEAAPSLGFSRQEHRSGLPFPSPMHESEKWKWSCPVTPDSQRPHGPQPTRLLCPWDSPGKSTGVGCHCLLLCGVCFFLNKSTSYLPLCLSLNSFCDETWRTWASLSPKTRCVISMKGPWVQVPIYVAWFYWNDRRTNFS